MASSAGLRERKKVADATKEQDAVDEVDSKKEEQQPVDLEPDFKVVATIMVTFFTLLLLFVYYKVDNRPENNGPFATFINNNILPIIMPKNRYQK